MISIFLPFFNVKNHGIINSSTLSSIVYYHSVRTCREGYSPCHQRTCRRVAYSPSVSSRVGVVYQDRRDVSYVLGVWHEYFDVL